MPMRYFYMPVITLMLFQLTVAQTVNDVTMFLSEELNGSARYNSMAGAFGALGGDLTAVSITQQVHLFFYIQNLEVH